MRIFEMKELPQVAGLAILHFDTEKASEHPRREGADIILPRREGWAEFFALLRRK